MPSDFFQLAPLPHLVLDTIGDILIANAAARQSLQTRQFALLDSNLADLIHMTDRSRYERWVDDQPDNLFALVVRLQNPEHPPTYMQLHSRHMADEIIVSMTPFADEDVPASTTPAEEASVLPDAPQRLVSPSTLRHLDTSEMEQIRVTEALYDTALTIISALDLDTVLDKILENVRRAIDCDTIDIMLIEDGVAVIARSRGYADTDLPDTVRLPVDATPTLRQMQDTGNAVLINDMHTVRDTGDWAEHLGQERIRSYVGVPIQVEDTVIGFLNLANQEADAFTENQLQWLQAFAAQAAIAINNARLYEKAQELAVTEERQRIAREIHDSMSQMLFSSSMIAESLLEEPPTDATTQRDHLQYIYRLNRGALAEMRLLLLEYRPENIIQTDLPRLLQQLKHVVEGQARIQVDLEINDGNPAPSEVRLQLYRIAQEAFNNISKHANGNHAQIRLMSTETSVTLTITDTGDGFDLENVTRGNGLQHMRERAQSIGADLSVESAPDEGTTIIVRWTRPTAE